MPNQPSNWKEYVKVWFDFYRAKTGQEYVFDGMQGRHLKQLVKKIEAKLSQKGMELNDQNKLNSLKGFLDHITDKWTLEHLEISLVNSKFNSLYVNAVNSNPFAVADRISDLVQQKYGTGSISR